MQIVKEFLYLDAPQLIGIIVSVSLIRELSPVLTSIVLVSRICSLFTSELCMMFVTEQIDALFILGINPINYLIVPRILSVVICLPLLNLISVTTGFFSASFISFVLYGIYPRLLFNSLIYDSFLVDLSKSSLKTVIFGFSISLISCVWGMTTRDGSKGVGISTTSSVVTCTLIIFVLNFVLSYFLFEDLVSSFQMI